MCILSRSMKNPKHCADLTLYRETSDMTVKTDSASTKIKGRRPGRPSSNISPRQRQERSRQSARECRSRKNVRYQYLEQLVNIKEKSVYKLRKELELHRRWCEEIDNGVISEDLVKGLSIDNTKSQQLSTAEKSNLPLPRQRSFSLPTTSNNQRSNLGLSSVKVIPKSTSTKDSKLYKLLTGRMSCTQSYSPQDTANEFHFNKTNSLSSGESSKVRHPYETESHSKVGTPIMHHLYTTQPKTATESYNKFHHYSDLPFVENTSNVYPQQQKNGLIFEKVSQTTTPTENQHTSIFSSFTKFDAKSQEEVANIDNYKYDSSSDFENLPKGHTTNIASLNMNQSSDECNIPQSHSDLDLFSEKSNADDTPSEMEFVDWILKNQSKLSSDSALIESARQLEDTAMVDIFSEDQPDIANMLPAQFDLLYSEENNIDTSNKSSAPLAQPFHGNIKIFDLEVPTTSESLSDNVLPSQTLHYMSTLPNMINLPTYSSIPFHRSISADYSPTSSNSMDTIVSQSHPLAVASNHIDLSSTISQSRVTSILQDVNIQYNQSSTREDFKEFRNQNNEAV
ncbi:uncharacterized protein LOC134691132 isoform X2 [Mytilus trossulus]|uniref:uncharacterized protein LOC134691132 isoform X2 n=1 Tax=Mytilus trossulus TaxID=6551 RepID=UPI0030063E18